MQNGYKLKLENPRKTANIFSKLFFGWMIGVVVKTTRKRLEIADLFEAQDEDKSKLLGDALEKNWDNEISRAKLECDSPSLIRALYKTFFLSYIFLGIPYAFQIIVLRSIQPIVLAHFIRLFKDSNDINTKMDMYISSVILIGSGVIGIFMLHHIYLGLSVIGMRVRLAVSSLVYRTMIKLSMESLGQTAAGQVVNLLSNDVNRFDTISIFLHALCVLPFHIAVVSYFLWQQVQISCLVGVITMTAMNLPIQGYMGKLCGKLRQRIAEKSDKRVKLMNGVISGIQVIKMYAWEKSFEKLIMAARVSEVNDLTFVSYIRGILLSFACYNQRTILCLTVVCYVLLGNVITADKVYSMAQFFQLLQITLSHQYPSAISSGSEALTTVKRLEKFLLLGGKQTINYEISKEQGVRLTNVSACWVPKVYALRNITLRIPPGSLCAIIGPVGAGKSSFLQLLLGELSAESGKVCIDSEISYSSQEPWLFSSTVRNNILFGQAYDEPVYQKTVKVCSLERDFEQFSQSDMTLVGDRGVTLSGGQKARVNLARAVYRQAKVYLMDDPLSAVDTHVGKHLFEECILNHLKGKTRVLVTHQLQYLKKADLIIVINQGVVEAQGTFTEISNSGVNFTELLLNENSSNQPDGGDLEIISESSRRHQKKSVPEVRQLYQEFFYQTQKSTKAISVNNVLKVELSYFDGCMDRSNNNTDSAEADNIKGKTNMSPLKEYFKSANSIFYLSLLIVSMILSQALGTGVDYWTSFCTHQEETRHFDNTSAYEKYPEQLIMYNLNETTFSADTYKYTTNDAQTSMNGGLFDYIDVNDENHKLLKTNYSMIVYGILILGTIIFSIARNMVSFKIGMRASVALHTRMLHVLLKAPMEFFDTNRSGRVLNRFSKDIGAMDEIFPNVLCHSIQVTLILAGVIVNIAISNPYIIVAILILGYGFLKLGKWFLLTATNVKRLEAAAKSPILSYVDSTLNGITTIRASEVEKILIQEFDEHQDVHTSAWYLTLSCSYSFGLWFDLLCIVLTACVAFSFVVVHTNFVTVSGSAVGLAISQCIMMTGTLQLGMRQLADMIQQLVSIERILQYTKLETEGPFETLQGAPLEESWPSKGLIEFKNLSLKYSKDNPPVLNDLSFIVGSGEKVGIVGRTGAGKSSLIASLFRLAPTEGSILIDGLDTKSIGLTDLRKKISVIPQDPILFSASLRYNLDPFDEFEDSDLWRVLEQVELKDLVHSLDFMVTEGGNNFSLGQKQLICLARASLKNNKILILDEATANVDQRTDSLIQTTIREKFSDCTVLTIAHRLNTIMDSDKVLVLSFGNILEFGHPQELLQIPNGHFKKMVFETGSMVASQLKNIAAEDYKNKRNKWQKTTV